VARPLRIEFPGAVYHVTSRGNNRRSIFVDDEDRGLLLVTLARVVAEYAWICHAYCLMPNHYHLLIETPKPTLSRGMRQLNGLFAQTLNRRHGRSGHLFQGRFHAVLIEKDAHLLEVARYVVLNPCRAGLCSTPEGWRWSSYRATAGLEGSPPYLTTDWLLELFGPDRARAREEYREFVAAPTNSDLWKGLRGQIFLGGDDFISRNSPGGERPRAVPRVQYRPLRPSLEALARAHDERGFIAAARQQDYTIGEIAAALGLSRMTVSRRLRMNFNEESVAKRDLTP